jgi:hypothetical protein
MTQQGDGSGRPPGGPPWPQQPPQGQWPQQPQNPQQGQWPQQPPYQQPQYPPQQPPYQQHYQQPPQQRPPTQPPAGGASIGTAIGRAFRLRIDPSEVTDHERDKLLAAGITSPTLQAFLAWRRSVLLIAAIGILPIVGFHFYDMSKSDTGQPEALKTLDVVLLVVDITFALLLWSQIGRWTSWRRQRRVLLWGWLLFYLMPFVVYLYPLRDALMGALGGELAAAPDSPEKKVATMVIGMTVALASMIDLAPKAVSLLPGILRAAITAKLLFPGASGPGWLILLMAPVYAVILYVVLIVPYQMTGNEVFVAAMVGLIGAQLWLGRMGYKLARPERLDEALVFVKRVRIGYFLLSATGIVFVIVGMVEVLKMFDLPVWFTVKLIVNLLVNTLLLALVATDLIVANLARGQMLLAEGGTQQAFATFQRDVSQFADPVVSSQQQSGPRR